MGFSNEPIGGGNMKFANFKEGKIITYVDGEKKSFLSLEGELIDIVQTSEEFEGKPYEKITLYIVHEEGCTRLGFPLGSGYGRCFCRILPNIDPSRRVKISGGTNSVEGSTKKYGVMFISQDGKSLKHFYNSTNEAGKKVPPAKEVVIGSGKNKRIEKDYSDQDAFYEKVMATFLEKKLRKIHPMGAEGYKEEKAPASDLPFDQEEAPF